MRHAATLAKTLTALAATVALAGCGASSTTTTTSSTGSSGSSATYTLAQVQQHASSTDGWTAINGGVYDLTKWVTQHPGGSQRIIALCGKDGSQEFNAEHGTEKEPNSTLASYKVGTLAS